MGQQTPALKLRRTSRLWSRGGFAAGLAAEHAALPPHRDGCWDAVGSSCFPDSSVLWMGEASWSGRGTGVAVHSSGVLAVLGLIALRV